MKKLMPWLVYLFVLAAMAFRLLLGTLGGTFSVVLLTYWVLPKFGIHPLGLVGLVDWFANQTEGTQGLLISSFITIVGFIVAFQTATMNWKDEMRANLRLDAQKDIDESYAKICELITAVRIFADTNLGILKKISEGANEQELGASISYVLTQVQKFQSDRQELAQLGSRANLIMGRYSTIFFATGNTMTELANVNRRIGQLTGAPLWVYVPMADMTKPGWITAYQHWVKVEPYQALVAACDNTFQYVSGTTGGIKGKITAQIFEANFSTFINFARTGRKFLALAAGMKEGRKLTDEEIESVIETTKPGDNPK